MDKATGKFKAKREGISQFHFHARVYASHHGYLHIMKGSTVLSRIGKSAGGAWDTVSGSIVTELQVGDEVFVDLYSSGNKIYSDAGNSIVFGGFFLAPF